jgi:phage baseplate assembly protein W
LTERNDKLGRDLKLRFEQLGADLIVTPKGDLETVDSEDNLVQAIISRLATDMGELYDIGHADYGSRLYEIIGEVNNPITRQRIKTIVKDCLDQEFRIKEITSINVLVSPSDPNRVDIEITVVPVQGTRYLTISYPFRLEE